MFTLPQPVLMEGTSAITSSTYNPTQLSAGMVHIGVGTIIHKHPAYYTAKFMNLANQSNWGIRVISLLPADRLEKLSIINESGSLIDVITASTQPEEALSSLADPAVKIVALSLTEDGEKWGVQGIVDTDQTLLAFDFLTKALARRREQLGDPLTILSCDDLPRNGDATRKALLSFVNDKDADLASWIERHVTFPNSVADSVTSIPAMEDDLSDERTATRAEYWEELTSWVIEDKFGSGRPDWEIAGVTFVDDSNPYEALQQRFQNASYSLLAYPAFLAGYRTVHEAMSDSVFSNYVNVFINRLVSPLVTVPGSIDLTDYKTKLLRRLSSAAVNIPLSRLCADGASKLPAFILPTLAELVKQEKPTYCLAFLLATYGHYLSATTDDKDEEYEINEICLSEDDWYKIEDSDVLAFLDSSPFASANLRTIPHFAAAYKLYRKQIAIYGVAFTLRQTMCTLLELH